MTCILFPVQTNRPADRGRLAAQLGAPESKADDGRRTPAVPRLLVAKGAAEQWTNAENGEERSSDLRRHHHPRLALSGQRHALVSVGVSAHRREWGQLLLPIEIVRRCGHLHVPLALRIVLTDHEQLLRMCKRQWLEEHRIDDRVDRGRCPNAQRERDHCGDGDHGRAAQRAEREPRIRDHVHDPLHDAHVAMRLARSRHSPKRHERSASRLLRGQAAALELRRLLFDVEANLLIELAVGALAVHDRADAREQSLEAIHVCRSRPYTEPRMSSTEAT